MKTTENTTTEKKLDLLLFATPKNGTAKSNHDTVNLDWESTLFEYYRQNNIDFVPKRKRTEFRDQKVDNSFLSDLAKSGFFQQNRKRAKFQQYKNFINDLLLPFGATVDNIENTIKPEITF